MAVIESASKEAEDVELVKTILYGTANHVDRFHTDGKGLVDPISAGKPRA